jgi:1,3-beta-galactosyl-N-acetylhexosamine phosphorylase
MIEKFKKGHMTLPVEVGQEEVVLDLCNRWQVDALRDSDGTEMPDILLQQECEIYSLMCIVRDDQEYARNHPEFMHRKYLLSFPITAFEDNIIVYPLKGYSADKYELDTFNSPKKYWEVYNRTTGDLVCTDNWYFNLETENIEITNITPFHEYSVSFLVRQVWDSTSMYNALTNGWSGEKTQSLDPYYPECRKHLLKHFEQWLISHPKTTVVRFTTFAYAFVIDANEENKDIYRDWTGYGETVSGLALDDFEKQYGYRMLAEDFVDAGYYNGTYKVPSKHFKDWMEFVQTFVSGFAAEMVALANKYNKKSAMFQGDHWIGTEPFLDSYQNIGIDINVGAVEDGVALRRLTDAPGPQVKEARFYPYFFPDVFKDGNNPVIESLGNWVKIRRAMLHKPLHRIGYGGYLSLANKFPDFIDHVTNISDEFSLYLEKTGKKESQKVSGKVVILNAWGKARSWLQNQSKDQRFYVPPRPDVMEVVGNNPLECLAGLPFDVEFLSFDDILKNGIAEDVKTIINTGDAGSAWSGGEHWGDSELIQIIRNFIAKGGAFLGIGDPSAYLQNGRFIQLGDILGIDKETSLTIGRVSQPLTLDKKHFLSSKLTGKEDFGVLSYAYPQVSSLSVIAAQGQHLALTANEYGNGRAVYLGNLPYSMENSLLLQNILLWLCKEDENQPCWISDNEMVSSAYYSEMDNATLVNHSDSNQKVNIVNQQGEEIVFLLKPYEWKWIQ